MFVKPYVIAIKPALRMTARLTIPVHGEDWTGAEHSLK